MKNLETQKLQDALAVLEKATERTYKTQGYSKELERLMILREVVREQIQPEPKHDENSYYSTRSVR